MMIYIRGDSSTRYYIPIETVSTSVIRYLIAGDEEKAAKALLYLSPDDSRRLVEIAGKLGELCTKDEAQADD